MGRESTGSRETHVSSKTNGFARALTTGLRDVPRNASWLVGRAFSTNGTQPGSEHQQDGGSGSANERTSLVVGSIAQAGRVVRSALPGGDSVEARLATARRAAEQAAAAEDSALAAAEAARDQAARTQEIESEERSRLEQIKREQEAATAKAVDAARRRAEADAAEVLDREQQKSESRIERARAEAEESRERAEKEYRDATDQLAEARRLADEAAEAADAAAEEARASAERVSAQAQRDADEARQKVQQVQELRADAASSARTVARTVRDRRTPGRLTELTKAELVDLATAQDIAGARSKTKSQLVDAIGKASKKS